MTPPEGYESAQAPECWGFAWSSAQPWLSAALSTGETVHAWAGRDASCRELAGRGQVFSIDAPAAGPEGRERWVVRHYQRGGAMGPILGDRYLSLGRYRPLCETVASLEARERGIPTPAVVAGIVYPAGIFYRADLVTEEVPGAVDLSQVLFGAASTEIDPEAALIATGGIVRSLERNGLFHPDLNAKNIVLTSTNEGVDAYLVDLDRCCARPRGVPAPAFPMRRRLERSLRKFQASTGRTLPQSAWTALHSRYSEDG